MLKRHTFPALLLLASPALLGVAHAAPAPERSSTAAFSIARDPSGQKAAAAVGAILRERVRKNDKLQLIEPGRVLSGDPRTREEETIDRARTALADGKRAYDALSLDDAIARLGQAVTLYQQTGPLLGDMHELETAIASLGAALTLRGSAEEGVSTFLELLTINPSYNVESYPPAVVRVFDKALEALGRRPTGSVEVYSTPPYASVFLDGEFRGVTPVTLESLTAGTHYIRLERDGYVLYGGPLEVTGNQRITSQTKLKSIRRGAELRDLLSRASREILDEDMGGNLRQLSRLLVAETLVTVAVSQSGNDVTLTGAVFDGASSTRLVTERAVVGVDDASFNQGVEALIAKLEAVAARGTAVEGSSGGSGAGFGLTSGGAKAGSGGSAPQGGSGSVRRSRDDGTPPAGKILGWVLIGSGAVALGVGTGFAIAAKNTHESYLVTPQASPDLPSIRDTGNTQALVADIALIGGGAMVLGGFITLILTESSDAPEPLLSRTNVGFVPTADGGLVTFGGAL